MKKNNNRKQMYYVLSIITVLGIFCVGGILAFLTDTDSKNNVFIIGEVDIALIEPAWVPTVSSNDDNIIDANKIKVGHNIPLDPKVQNLGDEDCYVYLKVYVPKENYELDENIVTDGDLFSYQVDTENWTELPNSASSDEENNIYVYYYNQALAAPDGENESITEPLFSEITLLAKPSNGRIKSVVIEAYAIQSTGLPQGTDVTNTQWAQEFITYASENPQTTKIRGKNDLPDLSAYNLGDYVDLETHLLDLENITLADNTHPETDWRLFSKEDTGVWVILSEYLPQTEISKLNTGLTLSTAPYCVNSDTSANLISMLQNETAWKPLLTGTSLINEEGIIVKGACTRSELEDSWNTKYGSVSITNEIISDSMYFPYRSTISGCWGYWLATPVENNANRVWNIYYNGFHGDYNYLNCNINIYAVRPVVFIPSSLY